MPSSDSAPVELLAALSQALASVGVRWYVFGAQAVLIWGRPRFTADVDVTVRLESLEPQTLVQALERGGFRLRVDPSGDFVRRTRVLPFVYLPSGLPLDLVLGGPGLEDLFLSRAVPVRVGDITLPVISPEDLIVTKVLAGRPKDMEDVHGVLRERLPTLDLDVVRQTLAMLEQALGQSDLQPAFEASLARVRSGSPSGGGSPSGRPA